MLSSVWMMHWKLVPLLAMMMRHSVALEIRKPSALQVGFPAGPAGLPSI
jgi:hypothetical protein